MGVIDKFGVPKPISKILNWARAYDMWYFQFGLACCAIEVMAASGPRHDSVSYTHLTLPTKRIV